MVLAEVATGLQVPVQNPDQVRRVAREVFSRSEFRVPRDSVLVRARNWTLDWLGRMFARLFEGARGSVIGWVLLVAVLAAVVLLVVKFARGTRRDPAVAAVLPSARRRSARDWREEAERDERRGAWREALRCRYRGLVADLADRGLVEEVPGRTSGEYRRRVTRRLPAVADEFGGATDLFESAWYGDLRIGPDENARFRTLADEVITKVAR